MLRLFVLLLLTLPAVVPAQDTLNFPSIGEVVRLDPRMDALIPKDAKIEVLGSGFVWAEGPVWVQDEKTRGGGYLLFSDIPRNSVMKWVEGEGVSLFMKPSGYTGLGDYSPEPGSNGLVLDPQGRLVFCEHGDRRVSVLTKGGGKMTLADNYQGQRLNSPNDAVFHASGDLYFTDPPWGLPKRFDSAERELDFCGVYRLTKNGKLSLATNQMTFPNGLAFSPDQKILYVAGSDRNAPIWKAFPVNEDGTLGDGKIFFDASEWIGKLPGGPDGLKVDQHGNLFATGPGGVLIITPQGELLGRLSTGERTANVAWGNDGSTLYLTADMYICRIKTTTKGAGWK